MTSKRKPYKTYPKEFKVEAVRMMRESDRPAGLQPILPAKRGQPPLIGGAPVRFAGAIVFFNSNSTRRGQIK